ncbi:MAG TPA: flagellar biosynthetic protein FliR, partial [Bacillota bacterium]|nr:flagellar biosynthetic protein FliR [Bacillota bacterium]
MEILFDNFTWFLLLLTRVAAIVGASPLLGSRNVPMQLKAALAAIIAIVLLPTIEVPAAAPPEGLSILPLLLKEVAAGLLLGYSITVTFAIFQLMGQFMDFPMGFSMVNVFDPTSQTQIPILGQFNYLLALMIFLLIDGHHFLFYVLKKSLELVPLGAVALPRELLGWLLAVFS